MMNELNVLFHGGGGFLDIKAIIKLQFINIEKTYLLHAVMKLDHYNSGEISVKWYPSTITYKTKYN